jgi:hypothetical protein
MDIKITVLCRDYSNTLCFNVRDPGAYFQRRANQIKFCLENTFFTTAILRTKLMNDYRLSYLYL